MNEVINAIKSRRSIRKFKSDMPSREDINTVIEAGLYAASGMGRQSSIIIAVTNKELRDKISRENCKIGGLSMGNMMLDAHYLGLGSIFYAQ